MLHRLTVADLAHLAAELPAVDEERRLVAAGSYAARDLLAQGNPALALATVYAICTSEDGPDLQEALLAEIGASWAQIEALRTYIADLHRLLRSYADLPQEVRSHMATRAPRSASNDL